MEQTKSKTSAPRSDDGIQIAELCGQAMDVDGPGRATLGEIASPRTHPRAAHQHVGVDHCRELHPFRTKNQTRSRS